MDNFNKNEIRLLDGGFSTQLAYHVGDRIDGDPLWTSRFLSTNPDAVYKTHLDYLRAGSNIIETNTYQASISGFTKYLNCTKTEAFQLIKLAVELAKNAVVKYKEEINNFSNTDDVFNKKPLIAGSVGSYGASLHDCSEYTGGSYGEKASIDFLMEWHRPRVLTLIDAGVDLLAFETIPCAKEAEALVKLLSEFPKIKAWLSFSCRDGKHIADGNIFKDVALKCYRKAAPGQLLAVGVNCLCPRLVTPLLESISQKEINEFIPLVAYPNSGEQYSKKFAAWTTDNDFHPPEEFVTDWLDLGVRYIGGCCRTDAKEIMKINVEIKKWKKSHQI